MLLLGTAMVFVVAVTLQERNVAGVQLGGHWAHHCGRWFARKRYGRL